MKTKVQTRKSKRNYLIVALIVVLLLLGVGYASFTRSLELSGDVAGTATWNVYFKEGSTTDKDGTAVAGTISTTTAANDTLTIDVSDLQYPGDAREVTAVIKNGSSMPIKLTGFTPTSPAASTDITFDYVDLSGKVASSGLGTTAVAATDKEVIPAGGECTYKFIIGWDEDSIATSVSGSYSITFTYEQNTIAPDLSPSHTGHDM